MRVLLVTQEFPPNVLGGVGYHAYNLARALSSSGHSVHVVTGTSESHLIDDSDFQLSDIRVSRISYRRWFAPRLWFARAVQSWLSSAVDLTEYDVIHAHEYVDFSALDFGGVCVQKVHYNITEKPRFTSLPSLPTWAESPVLRAADATIWRAERRLERRAICSADVTIANSRLTKSICERRHTLHDEPIEVVYNGVDADRFGRDVRPSAADFGLFVGGDQTRKGFERLLTALDSVDLPDEYHLKVVGSVDEHTRRLEQRYPVQFLGHVPQDVLCRLYAQAAVLVHPALYEPFGNVILEALASGTPVVVSGPDYCGAAEILDDGSSVQIDPERPSQLGRAIETFSRGECGYHPDDCRTVAERYSWEGVAEQTLGALPPLD